MSAARNAMSLPSADRIIYRVELLINAQVQRAREAHRKVLEKKRGGASPLELILARVPRGGAMHDARALRWALTGEESLTEKRRTARFVEKFNREKAAYEAAKAPNAESAQ